MLVMINIAQLWILAATVDAALARHYTVLDTARGRFRCLLSRHSVNHSVVATDLTQEDKYRLRAGRTIG